MPSEQLKLIVDAMRAQKRPERPSLQEWRDGFETLASTMPLPPDVHVEKVDVAGVPGEWTSVDGRDGPATVLYLHGGGYAIGSLNTHRKLVGDLMRAIGGRALAVDYRLAPEHRHPAAVDDATTAYRWLLGQGVDPQSVVVMGDSAGGGLTAATLLALRDAGDPLPSGAVMMSPWLDLVCSGASMTTKAPDDVIIDPLALQEWAQMYHGGNDLTAPLASPLYGDLGSLPPLLLQVGTAEILLDDSVRFAERAKDAGVDVTLDIWDDMIHVWQLFAFMLPEAQQAIDRVGAFVKERVAATSLSS
jgi:acetyl esterase/lipase